ncbi:hypothetical protein GQ42DRAFT_108115, partial [Ramicandelaber brevisporus]
ERQLRAETWFRVADIVDSQLLKSKPMEQRSDGLNVTATPAFVALLSDIVFSQAVQLADDAYAFAKHAKRSTVKAEDIKLAARRNPDVKAAIDKAIDR